MPTSTLLLIFSVSINVSVGLFFFLVPVFRRFFTSRWILCQRVSKLLQENPSLVRKFFRDEIFTIFLFLCGIVLLISGHTLNDPFLSTEPTVLYIFAIYLGHYVYKVLQDFLLRDKIPPFKINLLHHLVTISTYMVFLYYQQNGISGLNGLLFEGSVIFVDLATFLRRLGIRKNDYLHISCVLFGFIFAVVFRAFSPLLILTISLLKHNPLKMDYLPLGFFFMNIVFFSMTNGWLVKSSFESFRRRIVTRRIINELARARDMSSFSPDREARVGGLVLNNSAPSTQSTRQPLSIVIPSNESFRLAPPVSNVNMNGGGDSLVSNLTTCRHERTIPRFDVIVNNTPSTTTSTTLTSFV
ncbi:uncharacterized protein LOC5499133 isoform X1 [Nematostella vectensis]|uniref:uncharacterized protein LOC5499133 isoform X1 n=1 Tax=Nematostella vectensis TaxID=45351 RepID=UPI002077084D|nr:uncharacterized protein LOC5499133 isoform X1 [Nematostella vectensis]